MAIRGRSKLASVELNAIEHDALAQIVAVMPSTGPRSEANALRSALWHFGRFLGLDLPLSAFALRQKKSRPKRCAIVKDAISDRAAFRQPNGIGRTGQRHVWRQS